MLIVAQTRPRSRTCLSGLRASGAALLLVGTLTIGGCAAPRDPWVYAISRKTYPDLCHGNGPWSAIVEIHDPRQLCFIPVLLALPFVLDTVFLPVTIPRDYLASH